MNGLIQGDTIDFSGLDESNQQIVIQRLVDNPALREQIELPALLSAEANECVTANAACIGQNYALPKYAQTLTTLYQTISEADASQPSDYFSPDTVLNGFLKPETFRLLRT